MFLVLLLWVAGPRDVEAVVLRFNQAFSERSLEGMLATLADGSVRIDLFEAHRFSDAPPDPDMQINTGPAAERWRQVTPIIFALSTRYVREVQAMETHVDGEMAVVWATIRAGSDTQFREIYILRRGSSGWKIAAMTNNRKDA
ncbi:MAG: hypothetical protein H6510_17815 [Acidobacteria bacterium]|nr:hypothetical protein [Acidobacteriota bacterium]MCB9399674.1 hypothetical protein [Acidobacteriota bacterium]